MTASHVVVPLDLHHIRRIQKGFKNIYLNTIRHKKVYVYNSLLPTPESVIFVKTPGHELSLFVFVTLSGTECRNQLDPLHLDPVK